MRGNAHLTQSAAMTTARGLAGPSWKPRVWCELHLTRRGWRKRWFARATKGAAIAYPGGATRERARRPA